MVIVQTAHGPHAALLQATAPIHRRYCGVWHYLYVCEPVTAPDPKAHWRKLRLLLDVFARVGDGEIVLWLDSDALIFWPWVPLESVLLPGFHAAALQRGDGLWNTGVLFLRKCPATVAWLTRSLDGERGDAGLPVAFATLKALTGLPDWHEQGWLNATAAECGVKIQPLNRDFNECASSSGTSARGRPVIRAWHGEQFVCKMRGVSSYVPKASFLLEMKEHGLLESEAATVSPAA